MKPRFWRLTWVDPKTGKPAAQDYTQRAKANGAAIIAAASGLQNVKCKARFHGNPVNPIN